MIFNSACVYVLLYPCWWSNLEETCSTGIAQASHGTICPLFSLTTGCGFLLFFQYILFSILNKRKEHKCTNIYLIHVISVFLATCDVNTPQHGSDDIKGQDVPFLDPVVMAEIPPAQTNVAIAIAVPMTLHVPQPGAIHRVLERDHARFLEPNCITEAAW